ncbi:hypothetical protein [Streptomyces sp. NPDC001381]
MTSNFRMHNAQWVERWREEIVPLRLKLGFTIGGAWVDRERNQFAG